VILGDTASSLGSAVDELMRHQPSLRSEATKAIIKVCSFPVVSDIISLLCPGRNRLIKIMQCIDRFIVSFLS